MQARAKEHRLNQLKDDVEAKQLFFKLRMSAFSSACSGPLLSAQDFSSFAEA